MRSRKGAKVQSTKPKSLRKYGLEVTCSSLSTVSMTRQKESLRGSGERKLGGKDGRCVGDFGAWPR
jgi:hypothetical protein